MSLPRIKDQIGRVEDWRLTTGRGQFTGDQHRDGLLYARFARSAVASGRLISVDGSAARGAPGVVAVFTVEDLAADGPRDFETEIDPPREDGGRGYRTVRPFLARDRVRFVGEPVAMVVAESRHAAQDAVDLIDIEIDESTPVITRADALAPNAANVWQDKDDNIAYVRRFGDHDATRASLASAAHVTRIQVEISRVVAASMEPRAALGYCDDDSRLILVTSTQGPHGLRDQLASRVFGVERRAVRVIAPDVGGSFGMKGGVYREDALVLWAARRLGRPVTWASDRSEAFLTDDHARDIHVDAELGIDQNGAFVGLSARFLVNIGAYLSRRSFFMVNNIGGLAGVYRIPAMCAEIAGFHTNTGQVAPYRGAGRPEATYVVERLIDQAARDLGVSPFELRHQNLITPDQMPYQTALVFDYDCGNFSATMDRAAELARLDGFAERRRRSEAVGKLRGIGVANSIEVAGGPFRNLRRDTAHITVTPNGAIELRPGAMSVGQGHETGLAMLVAGALGVPVETVTYKHGDTDLLEDGRGSGGSSGLAIGGSAVHNTARDLIEKARALAAESFEADIEDIEFADGTLRVVGTDRAMSLAEVAAIADPDEGLSAIGEFLPERVTYPNGCAVCEVEIDRETGAMSVLNYIGVEDVGNVINPVLVEGQMHGGIAQGLGQAVGEEIVYHRETGQLLTASFLDYRMPRADDIPAITLDSLPVPTAANPLGVKGVGEAGTVGSLSAVMNAVNDALASAGVPAIDMPATPARIWSAISAGRGSD